MTFRKLSIAILLLLTGPFISAQGTYTKAQTDSLWAVWSNPALPDTSRIQALDEYVYAGYHEYVDQHPDSAFYFAQMEYDFAQSKGLKTFMIYALATQVLSWRARGEYAKELEYQLRLLRLTEEFGNKRMVVTALTDLGTFYISMADYLRALDGVFARDVPPDGIRAHLHALLERGVSRSGGDQAISALRFLCVELYGLHRGERIAWVRPWRELTLPRVLDRSDILRLAGAIPNRKHRLAILPLYASGLRVSEVVAAKVRDVDLARMTLTVRRCKGHQVRTTVLSPALKDELWLFLRDRAPGEPLLPAEHGGHLSLRSIQHVVERAATAGGLERRVICRVLRHPFATHLLGSGTDLRSPL